jgi:tRNA-specific 2-thiouridylase
MPNSLEIDKPPAKTRVVVAMSGGVDSSVVAALLKEQGYDVIGMTLQLYNHGEATSRKGACCAGQDIHDARRVAEKIGIAHYVLDYEERFRSSVIDKFADSYLNGETPVPCISCNQTVKFRDLLSTARELDADVLATGHYVQSRLINGKRALFRPKDLDRDQSYFLFATTPAQLDFLRFPLGGLAKAEVRALASRYELQVAQKPDSQDICFVPKGNYADMIEKLKPGASMGGTIEHVDGRKLGKHGGIMHFTVGQRKGLKIASDAPLYVIALDAKTNRVLVGPREALLTHRITLRDFNWLGDDIPRDGREMFARVRSTRPPCAAKLFYKDDEASIELPGGEEGVAPGQACVLYDSLEASARVLGGGFISKQAQARFAQNAGAGAERDLEKISAL